MRFSLKTHAPLTILVMLVTSLLTPISVRADRVDFPTVVTPHPGAGKFKAPRDPDKPLVAFYGGIGLWETAPGEWTGYGVTSRAQVDYLIRRCTENGIGRICGSMQEEAYTSRLTPSPFSTEEDFVAYAIDRAHAHGIEFFADQPCFAYVETRNADFARAHPYAFTRSHDGTPDTHMLSAAHPIVRRFKRAQFMEWVQNYPIDGLQLDFIRFPYYSMDLRTGFGKHGYDEPLLAAFRSLYGLDSSFMPAIDDPRWVRLRAEAVTQFIRELRQDLRDSKIELPIAVYNSGTYGRADSARTVLQDWRVWEEEGLVEEHHPMFLMTAGMNNLIRCVDSIHEVRKNGRVFGPIFLAEGFAGGDDVPTADMVRDAARRLIKAGCDGIWFCRASELERFGLWPVVKEISEWSIKEIRTADFDPAYQNLASNDLSKTGWGVGDDVAAQRLKLADRVVQIAGGTTSLTLVQSEQFRAIRHLGVYGLSARVIIDDVDPDAPAPVAILRLDYSNGEHESKPLTLSRVGEQVTALIDTPVRSDFDRLLLVRAEISVTIAAQPKQAAIREVELIRDPHPSR
jgi:hypothetical protein